MSGNTNTKSYRLEPSWKHYLWEYLFSILTIPLLGIGLLGLFYLRKKQKSRHYTVTDEGISSKGRKYRRNIDLVNIEKVRVDQSWLQEKLGVGTLILKTSAYEMEMIGMENPHKLKSILDKAIQAEVHRRQEKQKTRPRDPEYAPGSMEKINYLTGLWQEGLISEEDYNKERKHFED